MVRVIVMLNNVQVRVAFKRVQEVFKGIPSIVLGQSRLQFTALVAITFNVVVAIFCECYNVMCASMSVYDAMKEESIQKMNF